MNAKTIHSGNQLPGINLMKFLMAFAVVAIHSQNLSVGQRYMPAINWVISLAVPFFFIVTGYFTARRLQSFNSEAESEAYFTAHARKSLRLYLSWLLVYLPVTITVYLLSGKPLMSCALDFVSSILVRGESPFAWTLWYIYSTFFFFLIARFLYCRKDGKAIMAVVFFGAYLIGFCGRNYGIYLHNFTDSLCVRPLWGGNYIMIGMWIYRIMPRLSARLRIGTIISLLALSFAAAMANLPFATQLGGIAAFLFALGLDFKCTQSVNVWLRMQSMLIYFLHMAVYFVIYCVFKRTGYKPSLFDAFSLVAGCTFLLTAISYRLFYRVRPFIYLIQ